MKINNANLNKSSNLEDKKDEMTTNTNKNSSKSEIKRDKINQKNEEYIVNKQFNSKNNIVSSKFKILFFLF